MAKKETKPKAEINILIYDNNDIEFFYSNHLTLDERISVLLQVLQHEMEIYSSLNQLDDNQNLPS